MCMRMRTGVQVRNCCVRTTFLKMAQTEILGSPLRILSSMRRHVLNALVVAGALWLGVVTMSRGQVWLGACFILLAVLRAFMSFRGLKRSEREPEIRLDIEGDATRSDGSDQYGS